MALQASDIPGINATRLGFCSTEQLLTAYNAIPDDIWQQLTEGYLPVQVNPTDRREPYILAIDSKLLFIIDQENNNIILREKAILIRQLVLTPTPPKIAIQINAAKQNPSQVSTIPFRHSRKNPREMSSPVA